MGLKVQTSNFTVAFSGFHRWVGQALSGTEDKGPNILPSLFSSVQSLSHVWPFATPWTAAHQASLSIAKSQSLLKLMSIESVMPSNHLILCRPLLLLPQSLPASGSFPVSQFFPSGGQSVGASASASVLIAEWVPSLLSESHHCWVGPIIAE